MTFLLPICVSLTGLDHNPEIVPLLSNGVTILCGPPGKPELKDLTPSGIMVRWSQPECGCDSLRQYCNIIYYQKKCEYETSEWQKIELASLETCTHVAHLNVGDRYIFKICSVSDVRTLQYYSSESDPIVMYKPGISVKDIYSATTTAITQCQEMITLALSLADLHKVATNLLSMKIISEENTAEITLAAKSSEQAMILSATVYKRISEPERFQEFLNTLSNEPLIYY